MKKARSKEMAADEASNPLDRTYFFQDLPQDIQHMVLEGVRFQVTYNDLWQDLDDRVSNLGLVRDEIADDRINRNNSKKTFKEWLDFGETGA